MINVQRIDERSVAMVTSPGVYASLAEALHAAAQPLTILLASLSKEHTDAMQVGELRELAAGSAVEVQRVCTLFHYMQQLVSAEGIPPEMAVTSILPILRHVTEVFRGYFEQDGMALRSVLPHVAPSLRLDRARTIEALSNVLLTAHAVSHRDDTIEITLSVNSAPASGTAPGTALGTISCSMSCIVSCIVSCFPQQHQAALGDRDQAAPRKIELELRMAIAEAIVRQQQGVCIWSLDPFRVAIEWQSIPLSGAQP